MPARAAQQYAQALQPDEGRAAASDAELEFKQLALAYPRVCGTAGESRVSCICTIRATAEAEAAFKAALERNPDNAVAEQRTRHRRAQARQIHAKPKRPISARLPLIPNYAPAYLNLGVLYDLYLAEPQKALEQFEHYLALAGENKQVAGWVIELRKRVGAPRRAAKKEPA